MNTVRAIGWDLDHTLVGYRPLAAAGLGMAPRADSAPVPVPRPGIEQALLRLSARGYLHYVTTGGTREYAERTLRAVGLRQHIGGIFDGAAIDVRSAKRYRPLAQAVGFSDDEARARLIVTGDLLYDQPADLDGVVFIHQPNGYRHPAAQIEAVIGLLEDAGHGDLNAGFHALYRVVEQAERGARGSRGATDAYAARLPPGVHVAFDLRDPHQERRLPDVANIIIPRVLLLAGT